MIEINGFFYPFDNRIVRNNRAVAPPLRKILSHVTDRRIAVDGGAFVGGWSRDLVKHFDRVIAIELDPGNAACLKRNVPKAEVWCRCLGDKDYGFSGYEGDAKPDSPVRRVVSGSEVANMTIDSLDLPSCGFIKLDLQGYDTFALYGARRTLEEHHPVVMYEHVKRCYGRYGVNDVDPAKFLESLGAIRLTRDKNPMWKWR